MYYAFKMAALIACPLCVTRASVGLLLGLIESRGCAVARAHFSLRLHFKRKKMKYFGPIQLRPKCGYFCIHLGLQCVLQAYFRSINKLIASIFFCREIINYASTKYAFRIKPVLYLCKFYAILKLSKKKKKILATKLLISCNVKIRLDRSQCITIWLVQA